MGDEELEQLRFRLAQLQAELVIMESRVKTATEVCDQWRSMAIGWQQVAIAAKAKADRLEARQK